MKTEDKINELLMMWAEGQPPPPDLLELPPRFLSPMLCLTMVENDPRAIGSVRGRFLTPELCEVAVITHRYALKHVPAHMITPALCREHVRRWRIVESVPADMLTRELCEMSVASTLGAFEYVPAHMIDASMLDVAIETAVKKNNVHLNVPCVIYRCALKYGNLPLIESALKSLISRADGGFGSRYDTLDNKIRLDRCSLSELAVLIASDTKVQKYSEWLLCALAGLGETDERMVQAAISNNNTQLLTALAGCEHCGPGLRDMLDGNCAAELSESAFAL